MTRRATYKHTIKISFFSIYSLQINYKKKSTDKHKSDDASEDIQIHN